ncbi:MAG: PEP-CTERM sorting domain-containing protein [Phycisphaerae bacterium]|nr:PEP-CTERM sorting domain-containing protein [Phycisphaerae bacterium]
MLNGIVPDRRKLFRLGLGVWLPLLLLGTAARPDAVTFSANADAHIYGGIPGGQFGSAAALEVCNMGDGGTDIQNARKAWIRFDISSHPQPTSHATLTFHVLEGLNSSLPGQLWHFAVYGLDDDQNNAWLANGLTWDNAPGNDDESGCGVKHATLLGTFEIIGKGADGLAVSITGTTGDELVDFLNADTDGLVTFIVTRTNEGHMSGNDVCHRFASKEDGDGSGPELTLTPEPVTLMLLSVGTAATLLNRRNRKRRA